MCSVWGAGRGYIQYDKMCMNVCLCYSIQVTGAILIILLTLPVVSLYTDLLQARVKAEAHCAIRRK